MHREAQSNTEEIIGYSKKPLSSPLCCSASPLCIFVSLIITFQQSRPAPDCVRHRPTGGLAQPANAGIGHDLGQLNERSHIVRPAMAVLETVQDLGLALSAHLAGVTF